MARSPKDKPPEEEVVEEQNPLVVEENSSELYLRTSRRLLYLSHSLNQFSELSWQFCLILFLAAFSNYQSLLLVSTYGLTCGLFVCFFSSWTGYVVDRAAAVATNSRRLVLARLFIGFENLSVLLATCFCYILLKQVDDCENKHESKDTGEILLLVAIHILGATAQVLDRGFLVAIERDWIVVMSQTSQKATWLSDTNVALKQIDLSCQIIAPAAAGFFISAWDRQYSRTPNSNCHNLEGAALLVGVLNVTALGVEYLCTALIFKLIPDLSKPPKAQQTTTQEEEEDDIAMSEVPDLSTRGPQWLPYGLRVYFQQTVCWGGLGLGILYLNVLSFSGMMTAYLVWRGMRLDTIGVWRGISSAIGLLGTFCYHASIRYLSLEKTGLWSIVFQFCCLSVSFVSIFVDNDKLSLVFLIAGVLPSRVGLWVYDIAITQMMQEYVPPPVRGLVGGVQMSINAFFELLPFGLGVVVSDPRHFSFFIGGGFVSVGVAMLLYFFGVYHRCGGKPLNLTRRSSDIELT